MRRSWRRRVVILLLLLVVLPAGNVVWTRYDTRRVNERRLAAVEAALDQSDPGWRAEDVLAELDATRPPDDRNLVNLCMEIGGDQGPEFVAWSGKEDWLKGPALNRLPAADTVTAAREAFKAREGVIRQARTVRDRPTGGAKLVVPDNPLDTRLEHLQRARTVAALLNLDAGLATLDGDWPAAVAAVSSGLHVGRTPGDEPTIIAHLVRYATNAIAVLSAERLLGQGEPPAAGLGDLQAALLAEAEVSRLEVAFHGERAMMHRLAVNLDTGRVTLHQLAERRREFGDWFGEWVYRGHLPDDLAYMLEHYSRLIDISRRPMHEQIDLFAALELPPKEPGRILSRLLMPAYDKVAAAERRTRARLRSAVVGLACERFRQAHNRWPADLAELKALLPTVPLDPYDGQPLRYCKLTDGVVVYAVGPDRQDDGGNLSYGNPQPGEDVGFRLWDVAARRQPAEPAPKD